MVKKEQQKHNLKVNELEQKITIAGLERAQEAKKNMEELRKLNQQIVDLRKQNSVPSLSKKQTSTSKALRSNTKNSEIGLHHDKGTQTQAKFLAQRASRGDSLNQSVKNGSD